MRLAATLSGYYLILSLGVIMCCIAYYPRGERRAPLGREGGGTSWSSWVLGHVGYIILDWGHLPSTTYFAFGI